MSTRLGARDTRRLARHLSHCQSCRREALAAGLDRGLFTRPSVRERVATRVAGLLPFPVLARFRRGGGADAAATAAPQPGRWSAHLPMLSDQLSSGWGKAAAGAAVLVAGVGGAAGVHHVATAPATSTDRPAHVRPAKAASVTAGEAGLRAQVARRRDARRRQREPRDEDHAGQARERQGRLASEVGASWGVEPTGRRRPCHVGRRRLGVTDLHPDRDLRT